MTRILDENVRLSYAAQLNALVKPAELYVQMKFPQIESIFTETELLAESDAFGISKAQLTTALGKFLLELTTVATIKYWSYSNAAWIKWTGGPKP